LQIVDWRWLLSFVRSIVHYHYYGENSLFLLKGHRPLRSYIKAFMAGQTYG
jgi:hypothetical protein